MPFRWEPREHLDMAKYLLRWLLISVPTGAAIGAAVALFLWSLERVTQIRWSTDTPNGLPWLLYFLPLAGLAVGALYHYLGRSVEGGNNLIMDQIHQPGGGVPTRMAPLVLIGTIITHLFGGSAGREGTAVQMGGSIASTIGRLLKLDRASTRTLLMAGIAGGFGAVFGTPLTGAIFAVEVLAIGMVDFQSMLPCLVASIVGDRVTTALGIRHSDYASAIAAFHQLPPASLYANLQWLLLAKVALAAVAFGLASVIFAELTHGLHWIFAKLIRWPMLRPAAGAIGVIALAWLIGPDYLGIGVKPDPRYPHQVCILSCFHANGATDWSWAWKIIFTAVTLGSGFKGGEVTPLFFVGAALGNALARMLHAPVELFAGLGFVAVFAGATNTPMACTVMAIELFGDEAGVLRSGLVVYAATACFIAYLLSGHSGIYLSQRIANPKTLVSGVESNASLRAIRERRRRFLSQQK